MQRPRHQVMLIDHHLMIPSSNYSMFRLSVGLLSDGVRFLSQHSFSGTPCQWTLSYRALYTFSVNGSRPDRMFGNTLTPSVSGSLWAKLGCYRMTDRQTNTTEIKPIYCAASRVVKKAHVPVVLLTGTLKVSIVFTFNSHNP